MPHFAFYNGDPGFIIKAVSTSYSRRKFIVKHYLLDEIVNLDKLLFARENENNNIGDNQCQPYEQPPISPPMKQPPLLLLLISETCLIFISDYFC